MEATITVDKTKISYSGSIAVTVTANDDIYAYEARIVSSGAVHGRGVGTNALSDEGTADANGVVTLQVPSDVIHFNISGQELATEGAHDLYVYVMDVNGNWFPSEIPGGNISTPELEEEEGEW